MRLIRMNKEIVALTGEPFRVLDHNLLESAASAPINLLLYEDERDPVRLAVRLLRSVGKNHPFEQGNKRTAFDAAVVFLRVNGVRVTLPDTEDLAKVVVSFITGEIDEKALCDFLNPFCAFSKQD